MELIYTLQPLAAVLAAVFAGLCVAYISSVVRIENTAQRTVQDFSGMQRENALEKAGDTLLKRSGLSLDALAHDLRWAMLGGHAVTTLPAVLGRCLLYGVAIAVVGLLLKQPMLLVGALLGAVLPIMRVRSDAEKARLRLELQLPEAAILMAAELGAATPPEQAFSRAIGLGGPLAVILQQALTASQNSNRPLFGRGRITQGTLKETVRMWRLPRLNALASQLDLVANKGTDGAVLMNDYAAAASREYREFLKVQVAQLEGKLLLPQAVFVFIPFIIAVCAPIFMSIMQAF